MSELKEAITIIVISISIIVSVIFCFFLFDKNIVCPNLASEIELEYKYNFVAGGCFVKTKDGWIDSDKYRAVFD